MGDAWRCERCNNTYPTCNYRYMLNFQCVDHTGQQWLTAFDCAKDLLGGVGAAELAALKESDEAAFGRAVDDVLFRHYVLRVRAESMSVCVVLSCRDAHLSISSAQVQ